MNRARAFAAVAVVSNLMGACGGDDSCDPSAGRLQVEVAGAESFRDTCLAVFADEPTEVRFVNPSEATHDLVVYRNTPGVGDDPSNILFESDVVPGGETITFTLPPLPAGEYPFRCEFHTLTMKGTLRVVAR